MKTFIYLVRHGESPKTEGNERTRGLTDKGKLDTHRVTEMLKDVGIDKFVSSPYRRAVLTIEDLAQSLGKEIEIFEDLKETIFSGEDRIISDTELYPLVEKMFYDKDFSLPGGESSTRCQDRSIAVFNELLKKYKGQKVAIGTHGMVMTLLMQYFDQQYDFSFLMKTSKPDIYRMEFNEEELIEIKRLWED